MLNWLTFIFWQRKMYIYLLCNQQIIEMKKIACLIAVCVGMTFTAALLSYRINDINAAETTAVEKKELTFDDVMKSIHDGTFFLKVPDCSDATCEELKIDFLTVKLYSDFLDGAEDWLNNLDEEKIRYYKSTRCAKIKYGDGTKTEKLSLPNWLNDTENEMGDICYKYSKKYTVEKFGIPEDIVKVITKSASEVQRRGYSVKADLYKI